MLAELTHVGSLWPLAATLAAAAGTHGLLAGRRRTALNEALHELRRPLQALALSTPAESAIRSAGDLSLQTALALRRLDREINGGPDVAVRGPVAIAERLQAALDRWRRKAELAGASLDLRSELGAAIVSVDRVGFDQALDNLISNAIEHGGARIDVAAELDSEVLRITVMDSGRAGGPAPRRPSVRRRLAALSGRSRHGHGLRVVRRVAAAHGGEFRLRSLGAGAEATLELIVSAGGGV